MTAVREPEEEQWRIRRSATRPLARGWEFFRRLAVFAAIAAGLWVVYAIVTDDWTRTPWPIWPTLAMAVAVAIDAWKTFGSRPRS
jgi:hypothetical protein